MFAKSIAAALVATLGFTAQSAFAQAATEQQLAGVKANFQQAQLVPQFLPTFNPSALLNVTFSGNSNVEPGTPLAATAVSSAPTLQVVGASNFSANFDNEDQMFTVAMVDADIVGTDFAGNQTRHWLANNVELTGDEDGVYGLNYTTEPIGSYAGPGPASGSGPHRYVILLISQPSTFTAPGYLSEPNTPLGTFNFQEYISSSGLGPIVAANYITVENGQATVSISSTSAVQSSTLVAAAATTSGSSMASSSGTHSASGSHSASSVAATGASKVSSAASGASSAATSASSTSGGNTLLPAGIAGLMGVGAVVVGLAL